MEQLFRIVTPSRSGTKWFSRVFTTDHSFCFHELSTHLHPFPTNISFNQWFQSQTTDADFSETQRRSMLQIYPRYFARLFEQTRYGKTVVGNSEGSPLMVAGLHMLWPPMKFLFSVRNGINVVQSLSSVGSEAAGLMYIQLKEKFGLSDFFSLCCHQWRAAIDGIENAIQGMEKNSDFLKMRFEDVTGDIKELKRAWEWIGIPEWEAYRDRNLRMLFEPINVRTNRIRIVPPEEIWGTWSSEKQKAFSKICGEAMERSNYPLPG